MIILLLVTLSLTLAVLNYAYGVQQIETKTYMSQLSQPHVVQVSPDSVMASGRLLASYIIYPNGRVALINESISGIKDLETFLNGNPWAIIVFSNGQWINVTSQNYIPPGVGYSSSGQGVPYYPNPIRPWNLSQLVKFFSQGYTYNTPIYSEINVSYNAYNMTVEPIVYGNGRIHYVIVESNKTYIMTLNPTNPIVYGMGRILSVPVESTKGWLNFTMVFAQPVGSLRASTPAILNNMSFALIVQNYSSDFQEIFYFTIVLNNSNDRSYAVEYGNYQYWTNPIYEPGYYSPVNVVNEDWFMNTFYNYKESATLYDLWQFGEYPVLKVAIKFSPGEPAKVYLWYLTFNGTGFTWKKLYLPGINGTIVPIKEAWVWAGCCTINGYYVPYVDWGSVTQQNMWPINIYTESVSGFDNWTANNGYGSAVQLLPLVPQPGSNILVIPSTCYVPPSTISYFDGGYWLDPSPPFIPDTLIVNVTYSI